MVSRYIDNHRTALCKRISFFVHNSDYIVNVSNQKVTPIGE